MFVNFGKSTIVIYCLECFECLECLDCLECFQCLDCLESKTVRDPLVGSRIVRGTCGGGALMGALIPNGIEAVKR